MKKYINKNQKIISTNKQKTKKKQAKKKVNIFL